MRSLFKLQKLNISGKWLALWKKMIKYLEKSTKVLNYRNWRLLGQGWIDCHVHGCRELRAEWPNCWRKYAQLKIARHVLINYVVLLKVQFHHAGELQRSCFQTSTYHSLNYCQLEMSQLKQVCLVHHEETIITKHSENTWCMLHYQVTC